MYCTITVNLSPSGLCRLWWTTKNLLNEIKYTMWNYQCSLVKIRKRRSRVARSLTDMFFCRKRRGVWATRCGMRNYNKKRHRFAFRKSNAKRRVLVGVIRSVRFAKLLDLMVAPWLILPVVICLSQRLSHACLSASRIKAIPRMAQYISFGSLDLTQLLG